MASGNVKITITTSGAIKFARQMIEIMAETIDLIPEWQSAERQRLEEKLNATAKSLVEYFTLEKSNEPPSNS